MIEYLQKTSDSKELRQIDAPIPGSWVNIISPSPEEIDRFSADNNIPKEFLTYPLDENEKPRIEKEDGIVLIIFSLPIRLSNESTPQTIDTIPVGIILTNDFFVTVCKQHNEIINDFHYKLKNFNPEQKTRFLLLILHRINNCYNSFLSSIEKEIELVEKGLDRYVKNTEIIKFFGLKKTLIYFNTAVVSNNNVLKKILGGKIVPLYEEDEDLLEDIIIENDQSIEMVSVSLNIVSGTLDAYASIVANNLNVVMKTLAIITIFLAIPTMITSFYGMNIALPLQHHNLAWGFVVGISFSLTFLMFFFFKFVRWL